MAEPFLSEIRMFGFGWPPRGWATCDGQLLPINQNQSLFSLLGTIYGGDGRTTFALPDMRSRSATGMDGAHAQGAKYGVEEVTLTAAQLPSHNHHVNATTADGNTKQFSGSILAGGFDTKTQGASDMYTTPQALQPLASQSVSAAGGNLSHTNLQPSLVVNFCIATMGVFPSRN